MVAQNVSTPSSSPTFPSVRLYCLDWLRVFAILTVFVYHTTRFFNSESWLVKNSTSYFVVDVLETILTNWIMALMFMPPPAA